MRQEITRSRQTEKEVCGLHADMCKVFSHTIRLQILNALREREMGVTELAAQLEVSVGSLSQHLIMMKRQRVLLSRKQGNKVFYRLANPKILKAFDLIRQILFEQLEREGALIEGIREDGRSVRRNRP